MDSNIPVELQILFIAVIIDVLFGDPPNKLHPTAWIGSSIMWLKRLTPKSNTSRFLYGAMIAITIPTMWAGSSYIVGHIAMSLNGIVYVLVSALILKTTFSIRMLHKTAFKIKILLESGNLEQVRVEMSALVSRNTTTMDDTQAIAATIESVSENVTDSFVAPILAFALFGLPGAVAYRAINTLDSMIGYRGEYEYLGKVSAKLDDVVNFIPARLAAFMLWISSIILPGLNYKSAWSIMMRDHAKTPSPNAGWTMSLLAGALGVTLAKEGEYSLGDNNNILQTSYISKAVQSMYFGSGMTVAVASVLILIIDMGL
ncbi:MAG: cobalamin biosynthesis protein [SAR202 cluster bacterium]|nr:MAG: cobalamin biosynthesis protein [SAR202 cluster bacterium]MBH39081.1 cobalamin biosynthesis protein CobD [Chloroflexota bacterium]|tara:strand:- start:645 stop:1589 length:945 start_codon:yes stop_codon:yes gene_type:complete